MNEGNYSSLKISGVFRIAFVMTCLLITVCCAKKDDVVTVDQPTAPVAVTKTNPMKIFVHYMPWFEAKPYSTFWGSHWKMKTKNPDNILPNGNHDIASHFYPLIGPYDSSDPDVIDYHMLLMKYAGVDGILIDWYGSHNVNDYGTNLGHTNAIIDRLANVGIQFGVVYEEYTAQYSAPVSGNSAITAAQQDVAYAEKNYFSNKQHIKTEGVPLFLTFGPRYFKQPSQWDQIFANVTTKPKFLPLWGFSTLVGDNATGEFSWIDFNSNLSGLTGFYSSSQLVGFDFIIGSAFPRYYDFYVEGGTGSSYGYVDSNNGETMVNTLNVAQSKHLKYLQIATWNDFGEGTVIEPTQEDQFTFLESLQKFTGVSYGHNELALVYDYYLKKKKYQNDTATLKNLNIIFNHLVALEVDDATKMLAAIPN